MTSPPGRLLYFVTMKMKNLLYLLLLGLPLVLVGEQVPEEMFFADDLPVQVDPGELVFLQQPPKKAAVSVEKTLTVDAASLESGWVTMEQCFSHLDPVPELDIVYRYDRLRRLVVTSAEGVGSHRVKDQRILLEDIERGGAICVSAQVKTLKRIDAARFTLKEGPFQRRFLDGFFPMRVKLTVRHPETTLVLESVKPLSQPGFEVKSQADKVTVDSWFAGALTVRFQFRLKNR